MDQIPIQPVLTGIKYDIVLVDNQKMVAVEVATNSGIQVYFLEPEVAIQIGSGLRQMGKNALGGFATPKLFVPNGES